MVPNGWKKTHLKCVISGTIKNGYSPLPASTTTGYWVLSLGALTDHGINPLEIKPVVVDEKVKQALLSDGDFLISRSNTPDKVGRSIRFKNEVQNCSYPDLMMRFCVDTQKADPNFIEIKLKSTEVRQYYKSCAAGSSSSMVKINKAVVENTPLLLPSFPEQKKIAQVLSTWDRAISTTEQLLANSQQQKKALMQQLLTGKKRLLDNHGVRFSGEWRKVKVRDLIIQHSEKTDRNNQYPVLTSSRQGMLFQKDYYNGRDVASEDTTGYNVVPFGYFTYRHMSDDLNFSFNINELCEKGIVSTLYPVFKAKEEEITPYLLRLILNEGREFKHFSLAQKQGGSRTYMYLSKLQELKLNIPRLEEQQRIAAVLSTSEQEINALQQKLDALKQEKKALMQQLLTGKKRVIV
ncbi:restriction endonuclease subunit S [Aeromonas taiwanensis]|uniref:Restriction endonuclease subunit S n=1 Tax=Aeromonas taiwanensis TaxID=633417 RepID=A0A5F0KAW3_9GAMM|nr:restriction endonuclease subunit S [Aeromonas taiwanensis]TFF76259.1 restriction endonuclease subunit S [Aeromonas taiwanensis]TFF77403.1 restriction endonuclease subunit S [Aeromonas taiwanensis]TFF80697.1 restriction endonuclease subunit S [Aeromonas taiwanensis]